MSDQNDVTSKEALEFLDKDYLMPNALDVEREIIGLTIREPSLRLEAISVLSAVDFYASAYRDAFKSIVVMAERGEDVSALSLSEVMKARGCLQEIGGYAGLLAIAQTETKSKHSLSTLVNILRDHSTKRSLFNTCKELASMCFAPETPTADILKKAENSLSQITERAMTHDPVKTMKQVTDDTLRELEQWRDGVQRALKTGIPEWDRYLVYGGFSQEDLIYIAARSSYGKTALVWTIIRNMARLGHKVLFFSAEMDAFKLALRAMQGSAAKYTIDGKGFQFTPHSLRFAEDREKAFQLAQLCLEELQDLPIFIDSETRDWHKIKATARRMKDKHGIEAIFGDYIQLMDVDLGKRNSMKSEEVGTISKESKSLAKELDLPFTWISQIARAPGKEKREATMDDMSWSNQIGYDADVVVLLSGDGPTGDDDRRQVIAKFEKQRNGPVGRKFEMDFETDKQTFTTPGLLALVEIEQQHDDQQAETPDLTQTEEVTKPVMDRVDDIPF